MKTSIVLTIAAVATQLSVSAALAETEVRVPSDPSARYFVLELTSVGEEAFEIITRREGSSGTSYALRRVTCNPYLFGYMAEGDTLANLDDRDPDPMMSVLVAGSISDVISTYACQNG